MIDFEKNISITPQIMPWGSQCVQAEYNSDADPRLKGFKAIIVCDSLNANNERLVTMIARFPRCILAEINTHRVFSRNSASSRARSVKTTISSVMNDPYIPLFSRNHKGMGGALMTDPNKIKEATRLWLKARDNAVENELRLLVGDKDNIKAENWEQIVDYYYTNIYNSEGLSDQTALSVHKQNANRLIEPFMWHEALITSSYWTNFYNLRISEFAQPEIHAIATLMRAAMDASTPKTRPMHIPFVADNTVNVENLFNFSWDELKTILMNSAAECCRISYKDRSTMQNRQDNTALATRLLHDGHMSPLEHQAIDLQVYKNLSKGSRFGEDNVNIKGQLNGNLSQGWVQLRHMFEHVQEN